MGHHACELAGKACDQEQAELCLTSAVRSVWEKQMSKSTRNSGTRWTTRDVAKLRSLAGQNTPTRVIGLKLGRSPAAVQSKASDASVSLKPTNQSPYNRRRN